MTTAVIVDVIRTPSGKGKPGGSLSGVHPATLLADLLAELVRKHDLDPALVDDVIAGCVTQSGEQAVNIARTAVLAAGFPESVPATTIDRQCGSSQQAAAFAAHGVAAGTYDIVIACGVESMSRAPMFSNVGDKDPNVGPLAKRFPEGLVSQGIGAELIAARWKFGREELDEYAARSHRRASEAAGRQQVDQIVPVRTVDGSGNEVLVSTDETVRPSTTAESLGGLRPVFQSEAMSQRFPEIEWSITAGNSSPLTDGASAALIMSEEKAAALGLTPRARFHSFSVAGSDPLLMLTGPIPATEKILARTGMTLDQIDAYEVNEAFAPVPLLWQSHFDTDPERLNPAGGAIALGHPLGASGGRLLASMLTYLEATGGRYGLQTMCEGGGMANATIIERL
ncbi:thiolase family protein [Rhodococcus sp. BP-252]|uniref:Acetyl-CoA acetyltransferase n=1 Tax=Rhodococcoides kyotonense TaxID=398843 RepID=A0A177YNU1_9NOCA|nr:MULTISPECIES: thiolase family protein [Rhodococcus]MBY6414443.1 thiolase family protein [Rhodococcus sp. BP-320]MBY6419160.1 thiolase family protein [Rhodococcus sp. BP-321]MBY6424004.1 thiolase family protein [Rhodococcus sp. BP-324]MBY6429285.1 thiolase family protein [Rhodococcus sp. BP-323]MBY6434246.1 thiolase family protein [Rhodococcus sp. BP-322]